MLYLNELEIGGYTMPEHLPVWKTVYLWYKTDYQERHELMAYGDLWLQLKSRQRLVLGLTTTGQAELGTITAVTYAAVDQHLAAGDDLVTIIGTKATKTLTLPVSGHLKSLNQAVLTQPDLLNGKAEKKRWLIKLKAD
ncbi:glycine cleavage system protein H [Lactobacillus sp. CBA3606]|nr:glycine cleavage system protein H [Lactobacillus sp. CBA3606]